jgi:hypothetical protein
VPRAFLDQTSDRSGHAGETVLRGPPGISPNTRGSLEPDIIRQNNVSAENGCLGPFYALTNLGSRSTARGIRSPMLTTMSWGQASGQTRVQSACPYRKGSCSHLVGPCHRTFVSHTSRAPSILLFSFLHASMSSAGSLTVWHLSICYAPDSYDKRLFLSFAAAVGFHLDDTGSRSNAVA